MNATLAPISTDRCHPVRGRMRSKFRIRRCLYIPSPSLPREPSPKNKLKRNRYIQLRLVPERRTACSPYVVKTSAVASKEQRRREAKARAKKKGVSQNCHFAGNLRTSVQQSAHYSSVHFMVDDPQTLNLELAWRGADIPLRGVTGRHKLRQKYNATVWDLTLRQLKIRVRKNRKEGEIKKRGKD